MMIDEGISIGLFIAGAGSLLAMALYAVGVHFGWIDDSELCDCDDEPKDPRDDGDYDIVADGENQGGHS